MQIGKIQTHYIANLAMPFALLISSEVATAETIDTTAQLNRELAGLRNYIIAEQRQTLCERSAPSFAACGPSPCDPEFNFALNAPIKTAIGVCCCIVDIGTKTTVGKLSVLGAPTYEVLEVDIGEPYQTDVPIDIYTQRLYSKNCGNAVTPTSAISFTETFTTTKQISKIKSVTNGHTTSVNLQFKAEYLGIGGSVGSSTTWSESTSLQEGVVLIDSRSVTKTATQSVTVPAKTLAWFDGKVLTWNGKLDIVVKLLSDAKISSNKEGIKLASQVLDPSKRTFDILITMDDVSVSEFNVATFDRKLNEEECTDDTVSTTVERFYEDPVTGDIYFTN